MRSSSHHVLLLVTAAIHCSQGFISSAPPVQARAGVQVSHVRQAAASAQKRHTQRCLRCFRQRQSHTILAGRKKKVLDDYEEEPEFFGDVDDTDDEPDGIPLNVDDLLEPDLDAPMLGDSVKNYSPDHVNWPDDGPTSPAVPFVPPEWTHTLTEMFLAVCFDSTTDPKAFLYKRSPNMINHVAWARRSTRIESPRARVLFSRALVAEDMTKTIGSLIGIAAVAAADAEALLASEPYAAAGLFTEGSSGGGGGVSLYKWPLNPDSELNYDLYPFPHAVIAMDKPGQSELRAATRAAHLEYLLSLEAVVGAAPLIPVQSANGSSEDSAAPAPVGSVVFLNAESVEAAEELAAADPYNQAGLFESVRVLRFCDIDVEGTSVAKALHTDPVRDILEREGLAVPADYPELYEEAPALM